VTRAYETTTGRWLELTADRDPACEDHPHCSACGEVMEERPGRLVCDDCRTDALVDEGNEAHR
jgi:hypothetical protein